MSWAENQDAPLTLCATCKGAALTLASSGYLVLGSQGARHVRNRTGPVFSQGTRDTHWSRVEQQLPAAAAGCAAFRPVARCLGPARDGRGGPGGGALTLESAPPAAAPLRSSL
jgi:hypothetical protein